MCNAYSKIKIGSWIELEICVLCVAHSHRFSFSFTIVWDKCTRTGLLFYIMGTLKITQVARSLGCSLVCLLSCLLHSCTVNKTAHSYHTHVNINDINYAMVCLRRTLCTVWWCWWRRRQWWSMQYFIPFPSATVLLFIFVVLFLGGPTTLINTLHNWR